MRRSPDDSWFKRQITVGNLMSIATVAFGGAGFYFTTTAALSSQATAIAAIERKINESEKRDDKQQATVVQERQALRTEMTDRAEKTAAGIAELNKQTAVLSTQLVAIRDDLMRLGTQIGSIPGAQQSRPAGSRLP